MTDASSTWLSGRGRGVRPRSFLHRRSVVQVRTSEGRRRSTCSTACPCRSVWCAAASRPITRRSRASSGSTTRSRPTTASASSATCCLGRDMSGRRSQRALPPGRLRVRLRERQRSSVVDGEDLDGVYAATDFVGWYNGHPDHRNHQLRPRQRASASRWSVTATSRWTWHASCSQIPRRARQDRHRRAFARDPARQHGRRGRAARPARPGTGRVLAEGDRRDRTSFPTVSTSS